MRNRAYRRGQEARWKRRAADFHWLRQVPEQDRPRAIGLAARTPHRCSGPCCGNPRRWKGFFEEPLTLQEIRANLATRDQMGDL